MAIADKITSIEEHLQADYNSIEKLGIDLTNVNKNIENIAGLVDNIYNKFPKTEYAEGSNITLSNTQKGKLDYENNIVGYGDTSQGSTTGKNLLKNGFITETLANGIKIEIIEDKKIKISGTTSSAQGIFKALTTPITLTANTTYTFSIGTKQSGYGVYLQNSSGTNLYYLGVSSTTPYVTFTPTEDVVVERMALHFPENHTINTTIYLQLEKGNSATSYEMFTNGASPNPTYPQNIEVVTGEQEVKVSGKNLVNWDLPQNITTSGNYKLSSIPQIEIGEKYYFYGKCSDGTMLGGSNCACVWATSNTQILNVKPNTTFTGIDISSATQFYVYLTNAVVGKTITEFMLIKGEYDSSNPPAYEPYQTPQLQTISLGNIELCKIGTYQDYLYKTSGKNKFDLTNVINKQATSSINGNKITLTPISTWARIEETINVVAGQTYTISLDFTNASGNKVKLTTFDGATDTGGPSSTTNTSGSFTFTITPTTTELKVQVYANFSDTLTTNQVTFSNIQVEKGNSKTTYEPYGSDKWYKKEQIPTLIYDGTETGWIEGTTSDGKKFFYRSKPTNSIAATTIFSKYLKYTPNYGNINNSMYVGNSNIIFSRIIVNGNFLSSLEEFKTWVGNNNLKIYFPTATPNNIEITDTTLISQLDNLYKAMTYNGTTNIEVVGNLPMIMKVRGLRGE